MSAGPDSRAPGAVPTGVDFAALRAFVDGPVLQAEQLFLRDGWLAAQDALHALRAESRARGFWAPVMPADLGGLGMPLSTFARMSEILGRSPLGHYVCNAQAPDIGNMELLHQFGTPAQQQRWLSPLVQGAIRSCFAMTEPAHAGSNPVWMSTRATRDGDSYVISGHKWFTTAADGAAFSIVMAVTDPDAPPHTRASMLIVPMDAPGLTRVRNIPIGSDPGAGWESHAELTFENVRVPVSQRIGEEGAGFALAQHRLGPGRVHHCMRWIGICERAFDLMCTRATTRELAPGEPLARKDVIQHWVAESRAEIDAARLLVLQAAETLERDGAVAAKEQIAAIKFFTAAVLQRVLDRAIQVHGAAGLTNATPLAMWWSHERGARIYDGPDEVHKQSLGRAILKRYTR